MQQIQLFFLKENATLIHIIHTSVNTKEQHMHRSMCVFMNVCVCMYTSARQSATRVWSPIGFTQGSLYEVETPLPFLSSHRQLPQPPNAYQHTNIRLATLPPPPPCQAVVAVSVASSVTGEVPCYSRHCCRSATLRLCSAHQ